MTDLELQTELARQAALHHFACNACGNEFRAPRFASRCCHAGCTDRNTGAVFSFDMEEELRFRAEEDRELDAVAARYFSGELGADD